MSQTNLVLTFIVILLPLMLLIGWRTRMVKRLWAQPEKRSTRILFAVSIVLLLAYAMGAPRLAEFIRR